MHTKAKITVKELAGKPYTKIISVSGELDDENLSSLQEAINPLIADFNNQVFIFNFSKLDFMSSSIVGYFTALQLELTEHGRQVMFTDCNQNIKDIITFVGLNRLITCYLTEDEAVSMLRTDSPEDTELNEL